MATNMPASLVAAASNAGALGMLPCAWTPPERVRELIDEVRSLTDRPFGANFFAGEYLNEDSLQVALDEGVPVISFHIGYRSLDGVEVLATATSAEEARVLADAGVDVIVAQGMEAGGHRGSFLDGFPMLPLHELLESIDVDVPVLAAGGISTRDDVRAALDRGAAGVQVGTAFLFTPECERPREHLDALRTHETVMTDAYTGRLMRAARTPLLDELVAEGASLPFPEQGRASRERGPVYMGGTGAQRARECSVAELVADLCAA